MALWDDIGSFFTDTNWGDVAKFAPAAIGTAGQIMQMTDAGRERGQQSDQFAQQKAQYAQAQQQYQQQMQVYQQLLQQYFLQQQQQQAEQQRQQQLQQFAQQQQQAEQERQAQQAYFTQQQAYAQRLQDPAQVTAGAQAMYQPLSDLARQQIARDTQSEMAMRGVQDGQYANLMSAKAFAPYEQQAMQQAVQQWLASQGQGQGALQKPQYTGAPNVPQYTGAPNAPQAAGSNIQFPQIPGQPNYSIMPAYGGGSGQEFGKLAENVTKLLGTSQPGAQTAGGALNTLNTLRAKHPEAMEPAISTYETQPYQDWPTWQGEGDPL